MANTFELISSVTVGSGGAASIDFSSIPSTYTDLVLEYSLRGTESAVYNTLLHKINNDATDANYSHRYLRGSGSAASSSSGTSRYMGEGNGASSTSNTFMNGSWYFPNYAGSSKKSSSIDSVSENNGTEAYAYMMALLWQGTAAINQITIIPNTGTLVQYSTAYLYGVKSS
jgi:hypothetical protein